MTETPSKQSLLAKYDRLCSDINYAEQAGLSNEFLRRHYAAAERLNAKAVAAGYGPL